MASIISARARAGESTREKVVTRVYTADEGEFYDLGYDEASAGFATPKMNLPPMVFIRQVSSLRPGCLARRRSVP